MAPTTRLNRIQTPEKNLLNEIAYLTNLIESSKRTDAKVHKSSWKGQPHQYNFPGKTSRSFKRVNVHSKVIMNPMPASFSSSSSKSLAPLPSPVKSIPPAPLPEKVTTKVTSDPPPPRRYYEVKASVSAVQRVVQRRLPSDLIQSSKNESDPVQEQVKVEVSVGSSLGINVGQSSKDEMSKFEKPEKDQEYQTKRSRLLGHLRKLTSHKERLRGQKSNSVPDYLPC